MKSNLMDSAVFNNVEDFLSDQSFLNFYFREKEQDVIFWQQWINCHPEKRDVIDEALGLIDLLALRVDEQTIKDNLKKLSDSIDIDPRADVYISRGYIRPFIVKILVAAVFLGLVVLGSFLALKKSNSSLSPVNITYVGKDDGSKIYLTDQSEVWLAPGSELHLSSSFNKQNRIVILKGSAYFNIAPKRLIPFTVISGAIVSRVLGTCFKVSSGKRDRTASVEVSEGRVEVMKKEDYTHSRKFSVVELSANERVDYANDQLTLGIVANPRMLHRNKVGVRPFLFSNVPVDMVFLQLENFYGIHINIAKKMNAIHFTGDLTGLDFFRMIDMICTATGLHYEMNGPEVTIN